MSGGKKKQDEQVTRCGQQQYPTKKTQLKMDKKTNLYEPCFFRSLLERICFSFIHTDLASSLLSLKETLCEYLSNRPHTRLISIYDWPKVFGKPSADSGVGSYFKLGGLVEENLSSGGCFR